MLLGLTEGLSASTMSQSYFQAYSPMVFPASSPYYAEQEPSVREDVQGEDDYVERRDKSAHSLAPFVCLDSD